MRVVVIVLSQPGAPGEPGVTVTSSPARQYLPFEEEVRLLPKKLLDQRRPMTAHPHSQSTSRRVARNVQISRFAFPSVEDQY